MAKKQRSYSNEFKANVVLEGVSGQRTPTEACRAHKIHMSVLSCWRSEFLKQAHCAFKTKEVDDKASE